MTAVLRIADDDGYLALVDPDAYLGYIGDDWTFGDLEQRLVGEMRERRLLVWGSGGEGEWLVFVSLTPVAIPYAEELVGPISVTAGRLLVTSYSSLSMAAQFEDVHLPEAHERDQIVTAPVGAYSCRVLRLGSPRKVAASPVPVHYVIELVPSNATATPWDAIPWGADPNR